MSNNYFIQGDSRAAFLKKNLPETYKKLPTRVLDVEL